MEIPGILMYFFFFCRKTGDKTCQARKHGSPDSSLGGYHGKCVLMKPAVAIYHMGLFGFL